MDGERLAQIYDEGIVTRWDIPVGDAIAPHISSEDGPTVLVAECRTGYACELVGDATGDAHRIMAVDPSRDMLDLARVRLAERTGSIYFNSQPSDQLSYATGVFGQAVCLSAARTTRDCDRMVAELNRVVVPGGQLIIAAPTKDSLQLFYDLFEEALWAMDLFQIQETLREHLEGLLTPARLQESLTRRGTELVATGDLVIDLEFPTNEMMLFDPLIRQLFLPGWVVLSEESDERERLFREVLTRAGTYFRNLPLRTELVASWAVGRTALERHDEIYDPDDLDVQEVEESERSNPTRSKHIR